MTARVSPARAAETLALCQAMESRPNNSPQGDALLAVARTVVPDLIADLADARAELSAVIAACAPPVEALAAVHADGKWIAADGLPGACEALRHAAAFLGDIA